MSKNELKIMWLSRNTEVLGSSPLKNEKFMPILCDKVTQCLGSLTISPVIVTSTNDIPIIGGKRIMDHTRQHVSLT